jgi:hypothetical protein
MPGDDYIWTPGYWAWSYDYSDYYWVPGTWVFAPFVGALWTPGYWGWIGSSYVWHGGYWGTHIGYYGGINYGFGYTGIGYRGGYWRNGSLCYNRTVNNFGGARINNTYYAPVHVGNTTHVSYNGGAGGVRMTPPREEKNTAFQHYAPTSAQQSQEQIARTQPQMHASFNAGHPTIGATPMPGQFNAPNFTTPPHNSYSQPPSAANSRSQQYVQRPQSAPVPNYQTQNTRLTPPARPVSASPHYAPQQYAPRQPSYAPPSMPHNEPRMMPQHQSVSQHQSVAQHSSSRFR